MVRMVRVEWKDAKVTLLRCVTTKELIDNDASKLMTTYSVGFVALENKDVISLASCCDDYESFGNITTIPKVCIIEITEFEQKK